MGKYFESLLNINEMRGSVYDRKTIDRDTGPANHLFGLIRPDIAFFVCLFVRLVCFVFVSSLFVCVSLPEIQSP